LVKSIYSVDAGLDKTTCLGIPVILSANVTPQSQDFTYTWTPPNNISNSSTVSPFFTPTVPGDFSYVLTVDSLSCSKSDTVVLKVLPNDFLVNDTLVCSGTAFQI